MCSEGICSSLIPLINILTGTRSTSRSILGWHSIYTSSTVSEWLAVCELTHMHQSSISWPSTEVSMECQPRGQWSVNHDTWSTVDSRPVSIDLHPSIKHKLTVDWGVSGVLIRVIDWHSTKNAFSIHDLKIYANYSKKSRYQTTTMVISFD